MYPSGLILKAAELYFHQQLPQKRIAERLRVSVATVSRILSQALESGVVRVEIVDGARRQQTLARRMKRRFGLAECVVVDPPSRREQKYLKKILGKAAGQTVLRSLKPGGTLGLGPGETIFEMVESLSGPRRVPGLTIVPLMGGLSIGSFVYEVNKLVGIMAGNLSCDFLLMLCPSLLSSAEMKTAFLKEPQIREIVRRWETIDAAAFTLGAELDSGNYPQLITDRNAVREARAAGAVGDILGRFLDGRGRPLDLAFHSRLVSIPLESLKRIPRRIGIAGGGSKIRTVRAALKGGLVNVLVSDAETCATILAMEEGNG